MWSLIRLRHSAETASLAGGLDAEPVDSGQRYDGLKTFLDASIACVAFIGCLPVMVIAAIIIRCTSQGPALYCQTRLGRNGKPFQIYKLRTMYFNCEAISGAKWATKNDPRITPVGRILRRTHIDELPQLWNVLLGDMSLVGPRPERPEIVAVLEKEIAGYSARLAVKPGVTGLAQIQLPPDTDLQSVREKLKLDVCYVERAGPLLDCRILIGTVLYLMGCSYAAVRPILALGTEMPEVAMVPRVVPEFG